VDIRIILNVKVLVSITFNININEAAFCNVINSAQFYHLNPSVTPGNHQWRGAAPLFNRRGVQMVIIVYGFLSNVNRSSVNVFVTTMPSSWSGHDSFDTMFLKTFGQSVPYINSLGVYPVELHTELFIQFSMCGSNSAHFL